MRNKALLTLLGAFLVAGMAVASAPGTPVDQEEGITDPYLIANTRVAPDYPPAAYDARTGGVVALRADVLADGTVGAIEVLDSSRTGLGFERAAQKAVERWRFEPARKGDAAVDSVTYVKVRFNPPVNGSRGNVAASFGTGVGTSATSMAPGAVSFAKGSAADMSSASVGTMGRVREPVIQTYRKPSCGYVGCIYDRRDLYPPGSVGFGSASRK